MNEIAGAKAQDCTAVSTDTVTRTVAGFASGLSYEAIPPRVLERVKLHILDTLGCAVAGRDLDIAESARAVAVRMGSGPVRVFGARQGATPTAAAFANSVIANALDFDDGFEVDGKGMGHPGASLVPAALSALTDTPVSGRDLLVALVAAYEVNNRLILAMQPTAKRFDEVYGIAQHQAIGAAIAFGRLSGLDAAGMRNAIGLAGALTPLPSLHKYNWRTRPIISLKDCVAPAAQAGVQAVLMGLEGFVGSSDMLDGPQGYWRMIGSDRFEPSIVTDGLDTRWLAERGSFKLYPACRWLAPALEAFETAFARSGLRFEQIASIRIASFGVIASKLMEREPKNAIDAQFSLPFTIGAIAAGLPAGSAWFTPTALSDPWLRAIAARVQVDVDPDMDRLMSGETRRPSARATIVAHDGTTTTCHVASPLGGEARPVDSAVILRKAERNLQGLDGPIGPVVGRFLALENEPDIRPLVRMLFGDHPRGAE
jgi:2-methylcitrate dehydratase PrpD